MRLLLVEDDELLGDAVQSGLAQQGYVVDWLKDGRAAYSALKYENFEVIILDLGLPKMSGLEFLHKIRVEDIKTPVIILTARETVEDRVKGLDAGADDYLTKPFDMIELGARVRALTRRASGRADAAIRYKDLTIDPAAHAVFLNNEPVTLPRREFALLQKLIENAGHVLSRDQLMQSLYGWHDEVDSNALEVHIHNIRKKLNTNYIRTIRGVGYIVEKDTK